jgi:hypothetical protein
MAKKGLGQQLLDTMEDVLSLMEATTDPDRLKELDAVRKKISKEAGRLIETQLDAATAEYKAATAGLKDASAAIRKAIRGIEAVKKAIELAAEALDLVAKVAAAA